MRPRRPKTLKEKREVKPRTRFSHLNHLKRTRRKITKAKIITNFSSGEFADINQIQENTGNGVNLISTIAKQNIITNQRRKHEGLEPEDKKKTNGEDDKSSLG